jgi:ankyrin repeat protein
MFPNPQDALPLPHKPDLEQYRKLAKELVRAAKTGREDALHEWAERWVTSLVKQSKLTITKHLSGRIEDWTKKVVGFGSKQLLDKKQAATLSKAQFVIARSQGFESWPKFSKHLRQLAESQSQTSQFEAAADGIVNGDAARLKLLLRENPALTRARSTREHRATLLHYVSANGIEGYRQKTPKNIVEITRILLDAAAEVDATCNVYGSDCTTLGLTATSIHPANAGLMNDLLMLLLDRGACLDKRGRAGQAHSLVFACLANGQLGAARFLASRGAPLDFVSAAALDHIEIVQEQFSPDSRRKLGVSRELLQEAFRYACGYAANRVVEFLLESGADLAEHSGDGQTGTHYAAIFGRLDTLKLLLKHRPPLEAKNMYGGTVLGQTLWSAAHGGDPELYSQIIETLIAAGAKLPERHVPVNSQIDALLERYGSRPEPNWWWYGEEPADKRRSRL